MSRVVKTINIELNARSINKAIREVQSFQKQLRKWVDDLIRTLTEDGTVIAKMNVMHMNAVYTGQLEESIQGVFFPKDGIGVIFTSVPYALFVEFGTGKVGADAAPHPAHDAVEWAHDVHNHGDSGWVYFLETDGINEFRWTKGMPARPFMYETLKWLEENAPKTAENVPVWK